MSKMLRRSTRREIFSTLGRFISIFAIIAIGVGFFSGVRISDDYMLENGNIYLDELNFYDFRIVTPLGANDSEIEKIGGIDKINGAEGAFVRDALVTVGSSDEIVFRFHSLTEKINKLKLIHGRLPEKEDECVLDARYGGKEIIGSRVSVSANNNDDISEILGEVSYTVVGIVYSPLYLNFGRGGSSIGNGRAAAFAYLSREAFHSEVYDEIYVDADIIGEIYSDKYENRLDEIENGLRSAFSFVLSDRIDSEIKSAREEIKKGEAELADKKAEFEEEKKKALDELAKAKEALDNGKGQLDETYDGIDDKISQLIEAQSKLRASIDSITELMNTVTDEAAKTELDYTKRRLQYELTEVNSSLSSLKILKLAQAGAYEKYESGLKEYNDKYAKALEEFAKAEAELASAEADIKKAYEKIDIDIDWKSLIFTRYFNTGYSCFENDVNIVEAISRVFPIFFFAVAALVCMTTMTRMVDEQRTIIGTLMALGHKNGEIRSKYMFYAGFATVLGCGFGFALGTYFIPKIISIVYSIMYDFHYTEEYIFYPIILAIALAVSLLCSLGITALALKKSFAARPSELMRPAAPSDGGRILLEKTGVFWEKLPFLDKVTARNIFRYKKRMLMMIIGICCCTALLITGFGLRDSICNIVSDQFEEITLYDSAMILSDEFTDDEAFAEKFAASLDKIDSYLPAMQISADVSNNDVSKEATVMIPKNGDLSGFMELCNGESTLRFPGRGFVAMDKSLAEMLGVEIGSTVMLSDPDHNSFEFTVFALFDNRIGHYVIMSPETFTDQGGKLRYNTVLLNHKEGIDGAALAAELSSAEGALAVNLNKNMADQITNMLSSMDYIIIMVIIFAASLAFVVLFNLTNINITERKREIATLKVLGFTESEARKYVFRENNILTLVGALFGIPLGRLLHAYCMDQIRIDLVSFETLIDIRSYLISYGLTLVFVLIVNLFMRSKITAVDMAGSLKAAE